MSKVLKNILTEIIELATEWRDFSKEANGRHDMHYGEDYIRCYFASGSDHSSVTFAWSDYGNSIQVGFFGLAKVDGFTLANVDNIATILKKSRNLLNEEKARIAALSEEEISNNKAIRLAALKRELAELEGEAHA